MNLELVIIPFIAIALVAAASIPLGLGSINYKMTFNNITFVKFAALGMILTNSLLPPDVHYRSTIEYMISITCAVSVAIFLTFASKKFSEKQEIAVGASLIFALCMCIVLSGQSGSAYLYRVLSGKVLWATKDDVVRIGLIYFLIFTIMSFVIKLLPRRFNTKMGESGVYIFFALIIAQSVQVVGVLVALALLIAPISSPFNVVWKKVVYCYVTCIASATIGLAISLMFGVEAGPAIVLSLAIVNSTLYLAIQQYRKHTSKKTVNRIPHSHGYSKKHHGWSVASR